MTRWTEGLTGTLNMKGWVDGWMDKCVDRRIAGWAVTWKDRWIDGWTDSYLVICMDSYLEIWNIYIWNGWMYGQKDR